MNVTIHKTIVHTVKSDYKLTAARKHANYSTQTRNFLHAKTQFCPRKHSNTQNRKHANPQTRKHENTQTRRRGIKGVLCLDYHLSFVKLWFIWNMTAGQLQKFRESWRFTGISCHLLSKLMKTYLNLFLSIVLDWKIFYSCKKYMYVLMGHDTWTVYTSI